MPPKQKGDSLLGRNKVFSAAVEHVHVGIGHAVLGNLTMQLQGSVADSAVQSHLRAELDELLLTHCTPEFKQFRFEIADLCNTKALLLHYHRRIARELLQRLARPSEAFPAYLKASVAFLRDVGPQEAAAYFESFHAVAVRALSDSRGIFVASTERLQLVFLAQVAWLRDLAPALTGHAAEDAEAREWREAQLASIVALYTALVGDTKAVLRRLAMEALATLGRRVPRVTELLAAAVAGVAVDGALPALPEAEPGAEEAEIPEVAELSDGARVVDGVHVYAREMMCGMQGTLSTRFVPALQLLLRCFGLTDAAADTARRGLGAAAIGQALDTVAASLATPAHDGDGAAQAKARRSAVLQLRAFLEGIAENVEAAGPQAFVLLRRSLAHPKALRLLEDDDVVSRVFAVAKAGTVRLPATPASAALHAADLGHALFFAVPFITTEGFPAAAVDAACAAVAPATERCILALQGAASPTVAAVVVRFVEDVMAKNEARRAQFAATHSAKDVAVRRRRDAAFLSRAAAAPLAALLAAVIGACHRAVGDAAWRELLLRATFVLHRFDRGALALLAAAGLPLDAFSAAVAAAVEAALAAGGDEAEAWLGLLTPVAEALGEDGAPLAAVVRAALAAEVKRVAGMLDVGRAASEVEVAGRVAIVTRLWAAAADASEGKGRKKRRSTDSADAAAALVLRCLPPLIAAARPPRSLEADPEAAAARAAAWQTLSVALRALHDAAGSRGLRALAVDGGDLGEAEAASLREVVVECLAAPQQPLRVASLELLLLLIKDDPYTEAALRQLLEAETLDPLASAHGIDCKQRALTAVAFDCAAGKVPLPSARIVARSSIGLLHMRFSGAWETAVRMAAGTVRQHPDLWPELRPCVEAAVFGNERHSATTARGEAVDAADASDADAAAAFPLWPSAPQQQLAARGAGTHCGVGEWSVPRVVAAQVEASFEGCADAVSVAKTVIPGLVAPAALLADRGSPAALADAEAWLLRLVDMAHDGLVLRGREERLVGLIEAVNATKQSTTRDRRSELAEALAPLVSTGEGKVQGAVVRAMRRLGVRPYDAWADSLLPLCGTTQETMTHLNKWHVEDVPAAVRPDVVGAMVLIVLPKMQKRKAKHRDNATVIKRVLQCVGQLGDDDDVTKVVASTLARVLAPALHLAKVSDPDPIAAFAAAVAVWQEQPQARLVVRLLRCSAAGLQLLSDMASGLGTRFAPFAARCLDLALRTSQLAADHAAQAHQAGRRVAYQQERREATRHSSERVLQLFEVFPAEVAAALCGTPTLLRCYCAFHERQQLSLATAELTAHTVPPALALLRAAVREPPLRFLLDTTITTSATTLVTVLDRVGHGGQGGRSQEAVYVALETWSEALAAGDELLGVGRHRKSTLGAVFVEPSIERVFGALFGLVHRSNFNRGTSAGGDAFTLSLRMWREVLQVVAHTAASVGAGAEEQRQLAMLLEMTLKFLASPDAGRDNEVALLAADVALSLVKRLIAVDPSKHFDFTARQLNQITHAPVRTRLVQLLRLMAALPWAGDDAAALPAGLDVTALRTAFGRTTRGLNSFTDNMTAYDYDFRFHTMHALTTGLNAAAAATEALLPGVSKTAARKAALEHSGAGAGKGSSRSERRYEGDDDVTLPAAWLQPEVSKSPAALGHLLRQLAATASGLVFFVRDRERVVREAASLALGAMIRFGAAIAPHAAPQAAPAPAADADADADAGAEALLQDEAEAGAVSFLDAVVRPVLIGSLRRGVVARDPAVRLEHLTCIGYLGRSLPAAYPSFAVLYDRNADVSFYSNIASAQHKSRMSALGMLRHKSTVLVPRDTLRVFIPFLVAGLMDFAQGKRDSGTAASRFKGQAEALMGTVSHLAAGLPWEGYHYALQMLLRHARETEALRPLMIKAVCRMLDAFAFIAPADDDEQGDRSPAFIAKVRRALEHDVMPQLHAFIVPARANKALKAVEGTAMAPAPTSGSTASASLAKGSSSVHLPVAVAIVKLLRYLPGGFEAHAGPLLSEVVLKLRNKMDKPRIAARRILCAMMKEIGAGKLRYVVERLKDSLVHGYQLHVLGYTVVVLLESMAGRFTADAAEYRASRAAGHEPPIPPLDHCLDSLLAVFLADYIGETGAQKETEEVMSRMNEVKHSKALQGFVFLSRFAVSSNFLSAFVSKLRWLLSPEQSSSSSPRGKFIVGGEKGGGIDLAFMEKLRMLTVRVARGLMENPTLELSEVMAYATAQLGHTAAVREKKIQEFEARAPTRGLRGNMEKYAAVEKKTLKAAYADNFAITAKPERRDVDFSTHAVLDSGMSQQKQKLRRYTGRTAKAAGAKDGQRSFAAQAPETAQLLDALDEFSMKLLLTLLRHILGVGSKNARKGKTLPVLEALRSEAEAEAEGEADVEETAPEEAAPAVQAEDEDAEVPEEGEEDSDVEEPHEAVVEEEPEDGGDDLLDARDAEAAAEALAQAQGTAQGATRRSRKKAADNTLAALCHGDMDRLLPVALAALQGEGSDAVVTAALDMLQCLVAVRPPLPGVAELGPQCFDVVVGFLDRGGTIKHRALRTIAVVIGHRDFKLSTDDARQLVRVARAEILETSEFLSMGLAVLLGVVSQRVVIEEVFDVVGPVTEVLLHRATTPAVRTRCLAILAKFLTEYNLTREKLRSHVDLYLRNLQYPDATGRVVLLELLRLLVYRFPTAVLREEAAVLFVPLVAAVINDEDPAAKVKAADVAAALLLNAGPDVAVPLLSGWLARQEQRFTVTAMHMLPLFAACVLQLHTGHAAVAALLKSAGGHTNGLPEGISAAATPEAAAAVAADMAWCIPHVAAALQRDPTEGKTVKAATKAKLEREGWSIPFHALRVVELLCGFAPRTFFPPLLAVVDAAVLTGPLLGHAHPWVQTAALRVAASYLEGFLEPVFGVTTKAPKAALEQGAEAATAAGAPYVPLLSMKPPKQPREGRAARLQLLPLEEHRARIVAVAKRVLLLTEELDVDETWRHIVGRALISPVRQYVLRVAAFLFRQALRTVQGTPLFAATAAGLLRSAFVPLASVAERRTPAGYVVRTATLLEFLGGALTALDAATQEGGADASSEVRDAALRFVPVLACCTDPTVKELHVKLLDTGLATVATLRGLEHLGADFVAQLGQVHSAVKQRRHEEQVQQQHRKAVRSAAKEKEREARVEARQQTRRVRETTAGALKSTDLGHKVRAPPTKKRRTESPGGKKPRGKR